MLLVPNSALRFTPTGMQNPGQAAPAAGKEGGKPQAAASGGSGIVGQLMPRPPRGNRQGGGSREAAQAPGQTRYVWVLEGQQPAAKQVKTGLSDGRMTEVESEALKEGDLLITDQRSGAGQ